MAAFLKKIKNRILTSVFMFTAFVCFRLKITYEDPEQKKKPLQGIYICNHMDLFDGFVVRTVLSKINLYSLVTAKWYNKTWARELLFYEKCIPVDTENPGIKWIKECRKIIKNGGSISIFPEGHTSKSENVNEFKPGFLLLASMCRDVPVIPVATVGKYSFFFGERKRVLVGKPVYIPEGKKLTDSEELREESERYRALVISMKAELRKHK